MTTRSQPGPTQPHKPRAKQSEHEPNTGWPSHHPHSKTPCATQFTTAHTRKYHARLPFLQNSSRSWKRTAAWIVSVWQSDNYSTIRLKHRTSVRKFLVQHLVRCPTPVPSATAFNLRIVDVLKTKYLQTKSQKSETYGNNLQRDISCILLPLWGSTFGLSRISWNWIICWNLSGARQLVLSRNPWATAERTP